jgi:hypothetical protein
MFAARGGVNFFAQKPLVNKMSRVPRPEADVRHLAFRLARSAPLAFAPLEFQFLNHISDIPRCPFDPANLHAESRIAILDLMPDPRNQVWFDSSTLLYAQVALRETPFKIAIPDLVRSPAQSPSKRAFKFQGC